MSLYEEFVMEQSIKYLEWRKNRYIEETKTWSRVKKTGLLWLLVNLYALTGGKHPVFN